MTDETENVGINEVNRQLNLQHLQGKTLTGWLLYPFNNFCMSYGFNHFIFDNPLYKK